jgi:hypothetical protein
MFLMEIKIRFSLEGGGVKTYALRVIFLLKIFPY